MNKTTDRRVRKTKQVLRKTLTKLLLTKDIKEITVKELTSLADVNRGTFYLHYKDIYDMYEQIQMEIFEELQDIFEKHLKKDLSTNISSLVSEIFDLLSKNRELSLVIINSQDGNLLTNIIETAKPKTDEDWLTFFGKADPSRYEHYYTFITSGCVGLIRSWLLTGMKEAPSTMAKIAEEMISQASLCQ